jgi:hypothetical protein
VKNPETGRFLFFLCPHFGVYGFCVSVSGSSQPPLTFLFQMELCQNDTSFERLLLSKERGKEYNALFVSEYFQSLRAKK